MKSFEVGANRVEVSWYDADVAIVTLVGEHDLATSKTLWDELERVVRAREAVIVDLSEAEFIDSSVLSTLLNADRLACQRGLCVTLQLATARPVERILEVSGLDSRFGIARSRQEAIAAARGSASTDAA